VEAIEAWAEEIQKALAQVMARIRALRIQLGAKGFHE
jgi:hypothetical protein